jgi:hypothetical protein
LKSRLRDGDLDAEQSAYRGCRELFQRIRLTIL